MFVLIFSVNEAETDKIILETKAKDVTDILEQLPLQDWDDMFKFIIKLRTKITP